MAIKEIYIYNRLFILSDIHGELAVIYSYITRFDLQDCTIIQVGDFGYGFTQEQLSKLDLYLMNHNVTLLINRGNHDNYYNHYPELGSQYYNNDPHIGTKEYDQPLSNIKFLPDYSIINWKGGSVGKKILTVGGATSIDRIEREKNVSWWENEYVRNLSVSDRHGATKVTYISIHNDNDNDREIVKRISNHYFDIIVSHCAPLLFYPYIKLACLEERYKKDPHLKEDLEQESVYLNSIYNSVNPEKYYFGHYHQSIKFDTISSVYNDRGSSIGTKKCVVCGLNVNELVEVL